MGKRELVLISAFVLLGIVVYQLTAPAPPPGSEGVSIGGIFRNIRRGIEGPRESATADSMQTAAVPASVTELRILIPRASDLSVAGEDRSDISASLHVTARGFDQSGAAASARGVKLAIDIVGDAILVRQDLLNATPISRGAPPPMFSVTLAVPKRLALRMQPHLGRLTLANLAAAEIDGSRGETKISGIGGGLKLVHTGGALDIDGAASLKLTARNSRGTVRHIAGQTSLDCTGGDLALGGIGGPLEIEGQNTNLKIDDDKGMKPPLRINLRGGELRIDRLRAEARIDGRNADIDVRLDAPVPVTIYNFGQISVTPPAGGYSLDAATSEGHLTVEDGNLRPTEGPDSHAEGNVRGGGPPITLRTTRGGIQVRKPAGK
jgi:hypothetical protein